MPTVRGPCRWNGAVAGGSGTILLPRRVSTADQNPQLPLDALATEDCLKVHTDRASGTKADRPQWTVCLADLRPGSQAACAGILTGLGNSPFGVSVRRVAGRVSGCAGTGCCRLR